MRSRLGLMLYTLRADCDRDFEGTLRAVREIGYEGVELFDLHGHDAHEVRALLDELGLAVCGRHASLEAIESDLDGLAGELRTVGSDRLVLAWIEPPATAHEADASRGADRRARDRVHDAGLRFGFHNHDGELRPLDDGRTVLDRLVDLREEQLSSKSISGGHGSPAWSRRACRAPRAACAVVHVKDLAPGPSSASCPSATGTSATGSCCLRSRARGRMAHRRAGRDRGAASGRCTPVVRGPYGHGREPRMRTPARVGIVGCGVISTRYVANAAAFDTFEIVACADLERPAARRSRPSTGSSRCRSTSCSRPRDRRRPQPHASARPHGRHAKRARGGQARLLREALAVTRGDAPSSSGFAGPRKAARMRPRHLPRPRVPDGARAHRRGCDRRAARRVGGDARRRTGALAPRPGHVLQERRGAAARHGAVLPDRDRHAARAGAARGRVRLDARQRAPIEIGPRAGEPFTAETPTHTAAVLELAGGLRRRWSRRSRRPGTTPRCSSSTVRKASWPCPTRTRSAGRCRSERSGWLGGRPLHRGRRSRRARHRPP